MLLFFGVKFASGCRSIQPRASTRFVATRFVAEKKNSFRGMIKNLFRGNSFRGGIINSFRGNLFRGRKKNSFRGNSFRGGQKNSFRGSVFRSRLIKCISQ